jgi:hypothetical protein
LNLNAQALPGYCYGNNIAKNPLLLLGINSLKEELLLQS